jgi:hypothetical protein
MVAGDPAVHDRDMFEAILTSLAIVIVPAAIVLGTLALLGAAVAAFADAAPNGFIRPTAS